MTNAALTGERPRTLAEKVWDKHLVAKGEDGTPDLIYIDLHLVHEVTSPQAFDGLRARGLRVEVDERTESVGRKIREAELRKVPYMLVVGDREAEERAVSLRRHGEGDLGTVTLDGAVERLAGEAAGRDGD